MSIYQSSPDIIVVGAGVVGLACAWQLASSGRNVLIVEKAPYLGAGASGAAMGALWPPSPTNLGVYNSYVRESLAYYPEFALDLESASGVPIYYTRKPFVELLRSASQFAMAKLECAAPKVGNYSYSLLSDRDISDLGFIPTEYGAIYCDTAATVSPPALLNSLYKACLANKARMQMCATFDAPILRNNKVIGALINGQNVPCESILITAGAASHKLIPGSKKVTPIKGQMITFRAPGLRLPQIVRARPIYMVQTETDIVEVGSTTERDSGFDSSLTSSALLRLSDLAKKVFPVLQFLPIYSARSGLRPMSESRKPIVDAIARIQGAYMASAHYKVGLALAPMAAQNITAIINRNGNNRECLQ